MMSNAHRNGERPLEPLLHMPLAPEQGVTQTEDDWSGVTNQRRRRRIQNRLNQRAYRQRKRGKEHASISDEQEPGEDVGNSSASLIILNSVPYPINIDLGELDNVNVCQPDSERTRRIIYQFERWAYFHYRKGSPGADLLLSLVQFNVLRALWKNTMILGLTTSDMDDEALSRFSITGPHQSHVEPLPPGLHPTALQRAIPHHPWIDLLPLPEMRDNLLLAGDTYNDEQFCHDLSGYQSSRTGKTGFVCWGEPWDPSGWEVTEDFIKGWAWAVHNCYNLFVSTNNWRAKRGEKPLFHVP